VGVRVPPPAPIFVLSLHIISGMRNPRTLFIIGAGASNEAGLPTGKELVDVVARRLNFRVEDGRLVEGFGDPDILGAMQQHRARSRDSMNTYLKAAWRVREGVVFSNSIDSFLDAHRDDSLVQFCGKVAIVKTILEAERQSKLFIHKTDGDFDDAEQLKESWFFQLARHLNQGIRKSEVSRIFEKVSFVIFNYDRCFEHFMYQALKRHFALTDQETTSVMKTLKVIHPYGTVEDLPWVGREGIPFGATVNQVSMEMISSRIKTYTEQIEEGFLLNAIRHEIMEAHTLVFLGFSYHPENMKLLYPGGECEVKQVYGTALGISESNIMDIVQKIMTLVGKDLRREIRRVGRKLISDNVYIDNLSCAGLLQEYSRSLFL
jgi:hypothetical protein